MSTARQVALFVTVFLWAILIGGIAYSHIAFFPSYLHHLPQSTSLVQGPYAIADEKFWMLVHPVTILSLLTSLVLNWKTAARRKYLIGCLLIYVAALVFTIIYFVPELKAFAESNSSTTSEAAWQQRGKTWERFSWIRGFFMFTGFLLLLVALASVRYKNSNAESTYQDN